MLILLTCSSMVMAEGETVNVTYNSENGFVKEIQTTITENIESYFIWSIPESLLLTDTNDIITVKVTEAHIIQGRTLRISITGLGEDDKLQLNKGNILGSKVSFKKGDTPLNSDSSEIFSVDSSAFDSGNSAIPSVDIKLDVERNPFQYANTYTGQITFKATIS